MPLSVAIIINGISKRKRKFYREIHPVLAQRYAVEVFETQRAGHATDLAAQARNLNFDVVIAAGGDGTLGQVLNGLLADSSASMPVLGHIPLGTGNDFARACGLRADPYALSQLIDQGRQEPIDIGELRSFGQDGREMVRYFINECSIGMGPAVVKRLENSGRTFGPFLTYWKTIIITFFTHRPQKIRCKTPLWEWAGDVRVLAIANGRSFGNGLYIAPDATVDDGAFNSFIAGAVPLIKFLWYQSSLKTPTKIVDRLVHYNICKEIELTSPDSCAVEAEGELAGYLPASICMHGAKIRFLK